MWVEIKTIYWKQPLCEDQQRIQPWGRGTISSPGARGGWGDGEGQKLLL